MKLTFTVIMTITILMTSCVPLTTNTPQGNSQSLLYGNINYATSVGVVEIYPENLQDLRSIGNPVFQLGRDQGILLEFDLLEEHFDNIYVSFVHCSADWQPSGLADLRFLDEYNSFPVQRYEYSANTRIPYVVYSVLLPLPRISGNYLIKVTRNANDDELVLTRRISVFENRVALEITPQLSTSVRFRNEYQQINFSVNYSGLDVTNVLGDLKVVVLQNHRWETGIFNLKPTLIRQDDNYLEYRPFNLENNFPGLNEFRFFDIRTIDYRGMNISHVEKLPQQVSAFLNQDKTKGDLAYTQIHEDLNGNFYIQNTDPNDTYLQSEYVMTNFELLSGPIDGHVFVMGRFNNWRKDSSNVMSYDPASLSYKGSVLLKQGYYNYAYEVESTIEPPYFFEGSNYQTENEYEVFCYYRNPANNFDELVGYRKINTRL